MRRRCRSALGARDQAAVADYLDSVREIERRIQKIKTEGMGGVELPDAPVGIPAAFDEHLKLLFDMIALAFQANLTRVATFMMAREVSMRTYNNLGVSDAFHPLSHHQENPAKIEKLVKVQNFHTKVFAGFLDSWRPRRMATARCWIIPSSCSAATCATATSTTTIRCPRRCSVAPTARSRAAST